MDSAPLRYLGTDQYWLGAHIIWLTGSITALQRQWRCPARLTNLIRQQRQHLYREQMQMCHFASKVGLSNCSDNMYSWQSWELLLVNHDWYPALVETTSS